MADPKFKTLTRGAKITGYRGSRAGESFAPAEDAAKKQEEADWTDFAKAQSLSPQAFSGLGGGATRSRYRSQFDAWRSTRKGTLKDLMGGQ